VQSCCEVLGHDAIRLGNDHIMWVHNSLTYRAPLGGG
jgi:hypothetical protein